MNDGLAHPLAANLECFDYKGLKGNYLKIFQTIKTTSGLTVWNQNPLRIREHSTHADVCKSCVIGDIVKVKTRSINNEKLSLWSLSTAPLQALSDLFTSQYAISLYRNIWPFKFRLLTVCIFSPLII